MPKRVTKEQAKKALKDIKPEGLRALDSGPYETSEEVAPSCPLCSGMMLELGTLGKRVHYCCRQCGVTSSEERA